MSLANSKLKIFTALFFASMVSASLSCAAPGGGGRPHGPPPEAIEACADLSEGDACSFTGRRDDVIEGTCIVPRSEKEELACAPEGGPPGERGRRD